MNKFSVLMSIYYKEKAEYFSRSMQSIWDEQTIKPNEIILVLDGKLTYELYKVIDVWKERLGKILKIIPLEQNMGLGDALNIGLKYCSYELVARMDTDDISLPNRFEKQLNIFKNNKHIDVCSAWIAEFENNENKIVSIRKLPEYHDDIVRFSKIRSPINHAVVMFKKSKVEKAGGYKKMLYFEDYYLWTRMILTGAKFYNIQDVLLKVRAGKSMIQRRSGLIYLKNEIKFLKKLKKIGFLNNFEYAKNIFFRTIIRLMPIKIVRFVYFIIRNKK